MHSQPVFDYIKDEVIITDPEGIVLYVNEALEETTGYTRAEIIGNKPSLWGGQMPKNFYQVMWDKIKKEKKAIRVLVTNKRKNGKEYDALLHISPVMDTQGNVKMYVSISTCLSPQ